MRSDQLSDENARQRRDDFSFMPPRSRRSIIVRLVNRTRRHRIIRCAFRILPRVPVTAKRPAGHGNGFALWHIYAARCATHHRLGQGFGTRSFTRAHGLLPLFPCTPPQYLREPLREDDQHKQQKNLFHRINPCLFRQQAGAAAPRTQNGCPRKRAATPQTTRAPSAAPHGRASRTVCVP